MTIDYPYSRFIRRQLRRLGRALDHIEWIVVGVISIAFVTPFMLPPLVILYRLMGEAFCLVFEAIAGTSNCLDWWSTPLEWRLW